jgi:hypothetical protein
MLVKTPDYRKRNPISHPSCRSNTGIYPQSPISNHLSLVHRPEAQRASVTNGGEPLTIWGPGMVTHERGFTISLRNDFSVLPFSNGKA